MGTAQDLPSVAKPIQKLLPLLFNPRKNITVTFYVAACFYVKSKSANTLDVLDNFVKLFN